MKSKNNSQNCMIINPNIFRDKRGYFFEKYNFNFYKKLGITFNFVQDNTSVSKKNVIRGLHFQKKFPQGKLIKVVLGKIFDIAVDLRKNKSTFGRVFKFTLSDKNHKLLWVPPGFAHGFCVLSDIAIVDYKCTSFYNVADQYTLNWNDEDLKIKWPIKNPIMSKKDLNGLSFKDIVKKI